VTLVTLLKYGNGGYLAWMISFLWSKKILHIVECLLNKRKENISLILHLLQMHFIALNIDDSMMH
jgi:hypothetical protein